MDREQHSIQLEKQHVHDVYDRIAPHFSDTRYKAWPQVKQFLMEQEPGSLIADVGCGNGKYLDINPFTWKLGSDHCNSLASIAGSRGHEVMVCDNLRLPYRDNCFDAAISIAVVHHFATVERRVAAIRELARVVRPGGQVMIYVWALEQTHRKFEAQDVLVPWHMQAHYLQSTAHNTPKKQKKVKDKSKRNNHHVQDHQDSSRKSILSQRPSSNQHSLHKNHSQSALQQSSKCQEPTKRRGSFSILGLNLPFTERNGYHWNSETSLFRSLWNNSMEQLSQGEDTYEKRTATSVEGLDHQNVTNSCKMNGITEAYLKAERRTRSLDIENTEDSDGVEVSVPNGETREQQNKYSSTDRARKPLEQIRQEQEHVRGRSHSLGGEDINEKYYRNHHKKPEATPAEPEDLSQYHRYYHVFREGELAGLIEENVENLHILQDFYDHANWCVIAEKIQVWKI